MQSRSLLRFVGHSGDKTFKLGSGSMFEYARYVRPLREAWEAPRWGIFKPSTAAPRFTVFLLALLSCLATLNPASAATIYYPTSVEFLTDIPAGFPSTTTVIMESLPQMEAGYGLTLPGAMLDAREDIGGNAIHVGSGAAPIVFEFLHPVTVFGMIVGDLGDQANDTEATMTITFEDESTGSFTFGDPDPINFELDAPVHLRRFFGVSSDQAIKRIVFDSSVNTDGFYAYDLEVLPEPTTGLLLGLGLLGVAVRRRV